MLLNKLKLLEEQHFVTREITMLFVSFIRIEAHAFESFLVLIFDKFLFNF